MDGADSVQSRLALKPDAVFKQLHSNYEKNPYEMWLEEMDQAIHKELFEKKNSKIANEIDVSYS